MADIKKSIYLRIYDSSRTFIKTEQNVEFNGFSKYINGGLGPLSLKFPRKLDTFNENNDLDLGNIIEMYVSDEDGNDILIYNGRIEEHNPIMDGVKEHVNIVCYGFANQFNQDILRTGQRTSFYTDSTLILATTSPSSKYTEISDVVKNIIDKFNDANSTLVFAKSNVNGTDEINNTNQGMNYIFKATTYFEAIEKCRFVAPQNFYWFFDANSIFHFKAKSSTANHTFELKKNIKSIKVNKTLSQTKNIVLVSDGTSSPKYRKYQDDTSVSNYGRRVQMHVDSGLQDIDTINSYGEAFIEENKDPFVKIELEIFDNNDNNLGYDIESINPGDTCKIINIDDNSNLFTDNMIISQVDWTPGIARLIIEIDEFDLNKYITKLKKETNDLKISSSFPNFYTEIT